MGRFSRLGNNLYSGRTSVDFVGRRWIWYSVSLVIIALAAGGLYFKGLNLGVEFKGGVEYTVTLPHAEVTQANVDKIRTAVADAGIPQASSPTVNTSGAQNILVQTESMSNNDAEHVRQIIGKTLNVDPDTAVSPTEVGASWGAQVVNRSVTGLVVFLIAVLIFIWAYFREWKMSLGAMVALAHDLIITVGVYALSGFEVTPATVTGVLTILGFSLYDTVVVFDKVRENTHNIKQSRRTYAELANLAVNQTLVRSINTSVVALLPVGALLYVGTVTLGSGPLKDLALALFVGMAAGAYSSIFIATPFAVHLKEGEKEISESDARARARQRRDADRYANVPVFTEDLPIADDPDSPEARGQAGQLDQPAEQPASGPFRAPTTRPSAAGSGRVVPQAKAPVEQSRSAGRAQPTRKPRSQRGK